MCCQAPRTRGVWKAATTKTEVPRWTSPGASSIDAAPRAAELAWVAQLVEQRIENPRVGGSNPPPGTTSLQGVGGPARHAPAASARNGPGIQDSEAMRTLSQPSRRTVHQFPSAAMQQENAGNMDFPAPRQANFCALR